jgi:hypothetical protein
MRRTLKWLEGHKGDVKDRVMIASQNVSALFLGLQFV